MKSWPILLFKVGPSRMRSTSVSRLTNLWSKTTKLFGANGGVTSSSTRLRTSKISSHNVGNCCSIFNRRGNRLFIFFVFTFLFHLSSFRSEFPIRFSISDSANELTWWRIRCLTDSFSNTFRVCQIIGGLGLKIDLMSTDHLLDWTFLFDIKFDSFF